MRYHVSTQWLGTGCYFTVSSIDASMTVCFMLQSVEEITALVDALVLAANSKPEETTDAK